MFIALKSIDWKDPIGNCSTLDNIFIVKVHIKHYTVLDEILALKSKDDVAKFVPLSVKKEVAPKQETMEAVLADFIPDQEMDEIGTSEIKLVFHSENGQWAKIFRSHLKIYCIIFPDSDLQDMDWIRGTPLKVQVTGCTTTYGGATFDPVNT